MTAIQLRDYFNNGELDYEFGYNGKFGSICLCYAPKVYVIYDGNEFETNLNELMNAPFLDGKSLAEVAEEVELYG